VSTQSTDRGFLAGAFISETAVRDLFGRRRRRQTRTGRPARPSYQPARREGAAGAATEVRPLRRWSVSELIASAATARPANRLRSC
jgi:hypothetical protein